MESKFKIGDRVVCVDDSGYTEFYVVNGAIYTVVDKWWDECESDEVSIRDVTEYPNDFKLHKEEPVKQFDMKTQPWFIRVNNEQEFNLAKEWAISCGIEYNDYGVSPENVIAICTANKYPAQEHFYYLVAGETPNKNAKEIKLKFKTIIDSVEWPVVESEKDKKIRELKETIEAAAKQIKELEEM